MHHIYHTKYLKNEKSKRKNQNPMGRATSGAVLMLFLFFWHISFFTRFDNFFQLPVGYIT